MAVTSWYLLFSWQRTLSCAKVWTYIDNMNYIYRNFIFYQNLHILFVVENANNIYILIYNMYPSLRTLLLYAIVQYELENYCMHLCMYICVDDDYVILELCRINSVFMLINFLNANYLLYSLL